jgi:heme exporter protein A
VTPVLRFAGVALRRGGRLLFENLDLELRPGERLQVAGPNGSGKSSLIRLAAGLLADDHVALDRELALGRALGFWPNGGGEGMETLGIAHLVEVPVRLLSSGQLKRATLARVVASGAPLWLLDEPLNALDADGADRLARIIERHLKSGGTVLAASHQPLPGEWRKLELGV